jgi:hypothetical protein
MPTVGPGVREIRIPVGGAHRVFFAATLGPAHSASTEVLGGPSQTKSALRSVSLEVRVPALEDLRTGLNRSIHTTFDRPQ